MILKSHTILYVDDQNLSAEFYRKVLNQEPSLNVPGMTEFKLADNTILGLMPKIGILRLLENKIPDSMISAGQLRAEIYLIVDNPAAYHRRALDCGAQNLSDLKERDWGHIAAYCLDMDGHVLAFAADLSIT